MASNQRWLYCANQACPDERMILADAEKYCVACEELLTCAPDCECGEAINLKYLLSLKPIFFACVGCEKRFTNHYLAVRMAKKMAQLKEQVVYALHDLEGLLNKRSGDASDRRPR